MKTMTLKNRMVLIGAVNVLAAAVIVLTRFLGLESPFLGGFGIGLFAVVFPFLIFLVIKYNNREYQQDYDMSVNDERVIRNSEKAGSVAYLIQTLMMIATAIFSYVLDFDLYFPVMGVLLVSVVFSKVYNYRLNHKKQ